MGSNAWLRSASGVGLAFLMLGSVSDTYAGGGLDGIKGHIDIPEIARIPGAPGTFDHHQSTIGLLMDDWDFGVDGWLSNAPLPDDRTTPPPQSSDRVDDPFQGPSLGSLIVTGPAMGRGDSSIGADGLMTSHTVPGPGGVIPLMLGVAALGRRRR